MRLIFIVWILGAIGWVLNICRIASGLGVTLDHITLLTIFRIFGVFVFPLGCVLGYIPG